MTSLLSPLSSLSYLQDLAWVFCPRQNTIKLVIRHHHGRPFEMQQHPQLSNGFDRTSCGHNMLVRQCFPILERTCTNLNTFSHVFCLNCAHKSGLSRSTEADRKCPACGTQLSNPDDAVTTIIHPTEDYKTSVLSGLDPTTIMECAGRGLAFWSYQTTQEMYPSFTLLSNRAADHVQIVQRSNGQEPRRQVQSSQQSA